MRTVKCELSKVEVSVGKRRRGLVLLAGLVLPGLGLSTLACGGGGGSGPGAVSPQDRSGVASASGQAVSKEAASSYKAALNEFGQHDRSFDWNDTACTKVAGMFVAASSRQVNDGGKALPEALYNAGLAYMRCGMEQEAVAQYNAAEAANPGYHRVRAQMALFDYQKTQDIDRAISSLEQVIRDAKFQNAEALVSLAALQMTRANETANDDGRNDFERAKKNIQRALAIDDAYMPAFNQLAIYYLELAKQKSGLSTQQRRRGLVVAGAGGARVNQQMLELAALVSSQAVQKNPNYAPIHNTAGLIQVELQNFNGAVKSFGQARKLDPKFYEAHMNFAAVSISFRGFKEAEEAYRDALKLSPDDYEAHLGLALALRGQINDANFDQLVAESQQHLDRCKSLDGSRPEAFYNEAILTQEYKSKGEEAKAIPALEKAAEIYREFIGKAGGDGSFEEAVKRAKDRTQDIEDTVKFIREGKEAQRIADDEAVQRKAEEERLAKEAAAAEAAAPAPQATPSGDAPGGVAAPAPPVSKPPEKTTP